MKYDVVLDGEERSVEVRRASDGWWVSVDGGPERKVQGQVPSDHRWTLRSPEGRTKVELALTGDTVFLRHRDRVHRGHVVDPRASALGEGGAGSEGAIATQMPGAIVRVMVTEGDHVEEGQVLLVVEAMKMENEFKSPFAGVVTGVHVAVGQSIHAGAKLVDVQRDDT
jgi:biotin carboxyl carrier protein